MFLWSHWASSSFICSKYIRTWSGKHVPMDGLRWSSIGTCWKTSSLFYLGHMLISMQESDNHKGYKLQIKDSLSDIGLRLTVLRLWLESELNLGLLDGRGRPCSSIKTVELISEIQERCAWLYDFVSLSRQMRMSLVLSSVISLV